MLHSDGTTNTETTTVAVTVTPVADVVADTVSTPEDTPVTFDVSANDLFADPTNVTVSVAPINQPANGTVTVNPIGTLTYVPDADFTGMDSLVYTATVLHQDGSINTETSTVTVTVTPVADVVDDTVTTDQDMPALIDVLANDLFADPTKVTVTVALANQPADGVVTVSVDGTLSYTPNVGFTGTDVFDYTATVLHRDGSTNAETATVMVTVIPLGDAAADTATTAEDTPVMIDVLTNDRFSDPPNVTLSIAPGDGPSNGTVTINQDGTLSYTPDADFTGEDTFVYTGTEMPEDGSINIDTAIVSVTVTPVADAVADTITTDEDTPALIDVLANDLFSDPTNVTVSVAPANQPANGTVTVNPNGILTYVPDADFTGTDSLVYTTTVLHPDGSTNTETATVRVAVTPVTDVVDEMFTTAEDTPVTFNVLANDGFADPTKVTVSVAPANQPANGTVTVNPNGTLTYVPDADFTGTDSLVYTGTVLHQDGSINTETATVTVKVTPVTDVVDDMFATPEETPVTFDVLANDLFSDPTNVTVSVAPANQPANGTVTVNPNGILTYVPDADFTGTDTVVYTATVLHRDGSTGTEMGAVMVMATPVDDVVADMVTTQEDTPVTFDVLANDLFADPTNVAVSVASANQPANGMATVNPNGTLTYDPDADFTGTDSFAYTAKVLYPDGSINSETATVTVRVTQVSDTVEDTVTTPEDTPVTIDVLANDLFADPTQVTVSMAPGREAFNGNVMINPDGTLSYAPDADFTGTDTFVYTTTILHGDGTTNTETAMVTVIVTPVADAVDDMVTTPEDTPINIDVFSNDRFSDPSGVLVDVASGNEASNGSVRINNNGTLSYTPEADFNGTDSFAYTTTVIHGDGGTNTETATVTVIVTPVDEVIAIAVDDNVTTNEDTPIVIDVLSNDTFSGPGISVELSGVTNPVNGTATIGPGGIINFTPDPNFNGNDSFDYQVTVRSDQQTITETATVTVTVIPVADAVSDMITIEQDTLIVIDVLDNDGFTDQGGAVLQIEVTTLPVQGTIESINNDGTISYRPGPGFIGVDSFAYTVTVIQEAGNSNTEGATVTVAVTGVPVSPGTLPPGFPPETPQFPVRDREPADSHSPRRTDTPSNPPDGGTSDRTVAPVGTTGGNLGGLEPLTPTSDSFANGSAAGGPEISTVVININGDMVQQSDVLIAGDAGSSSISRDGGDPSVGIDSNGAQAATRQGGPATPADGSTPANQIAPSNGVQGNAADSGLSGITGDGSSAGPQANDTSVVNADGTPSTSTEARTDAGARDATVPGDTSDATGTPADGSTPADETAASNEVTENTADSGPSGIPGDGFSTNPQAKDNAGVNADGTPTTETSASDNAGISTTAQSPVSVSVDPLSETNSFSVAEDTSVVRIREPASQDAAASGSVRITVEPGDGPANGTVIVNADGSIDFIANADFNGTDTFTYTRTLTHADGTTTTERVRVEAMVEPGVDVVYDTVTMLANGSAITIDVLANDSFSDPTQVAVSVTAGDGPGNGSVTVNADGTIDYAPNRGFIGTDVFKYTTTVTNKDGSSTIEAAKVTIEVQPFSGALNDGRHPPLQGMLGKPSGAELFLVGCTVVILSRTFLVPVAIKEDSLATDNSLVLWGSRRKVELFSDQLARAAVQFEAGVARIKSAFRNKK